MSASVNVNATFYILSLKIKLMLFGGQKGIGDSF